MNILYLTHSNDGGGARVALVNMATELIRKGHSICVIVPSKDSPIAQDMRNAGASIYIAPISPTVYPNCKNPLKWIKRLIWKIFEWRKTKNIITKIIKEKNIDLVHTNIGPMDLALDICKKCNIPHIWHQREFFDKYADIHFFPTQKKFIRQINDKRNYNIAITLYLYDYYELSNTGNRSKVIYDGVFSINQIPSIITPQEEKERYFLTVARVEKNKGIYDLILSFITFHANHPEYELKIIGSFTQTNTYFIKCLNLINENNVKQKVHFMGERNDVYQQMARATAVIVPSFYEGFGFTTVEAMLNHTLVIGRNTTGTKEQFDNGIKDTRKEIGLRFNDTTELTNAMEEAILVDHSEMIERAYQHVCNSYSAEESAHEVESFYNQIINRNKK